jgi:hypothetical protein
MDAGVLLAIAAFVALAIASALVIRRAGRVLAETREAETFRRAAVDLADRIERSLSGASQRIDHVRRRELDASAIGDTLSAAQDAVVRYAAEARLLRPPREMRGIQADLVAELERAERALGMVEHGCTMLASAGRGPRELEGQTSIKRGYLNLLHAREAIARHAADAVATRVTVERSRRSEARDHTM